MISSHYFPRHSSTPFSPEFKEHCKADAWKAATWLTEGGAILGSALFACSVNDEFTRQGGKVMMKEKSKLLAAAGTVLKKSPIACLAIGGLFAVSWFTMGQFTNLLFKSFFGFSLKEAKQANLNNAKKLEVQANNSV
jgi:hypothetical protein